MTSRTARARRVAFCTLLALGFACERGKNSASGRNQATPVRVTQTSRIDAPVEFSGSGIVEPLQTVAVTAQVTGTILEVLFREGDFVQKGQPLFTLDPRPLQAIVDQARATLQRDEAQAVAAAHDDARYAQLAAKGYVSHSQADQFHATALAAAATVNADRAALRAALVNLGFTSVLAPIPGRTGSVLVKTGNNVGPGTGPLVIINQIRPVLVRFPVLEQQFAPMQRALATHPLRVIATSSDSTEAPESGELRFLDNAVDSLTGTVMGKAEFPNLASRLWPGELVFVSVQVDVQRNVLAVPTTAVLTGQRGAFVYVVDAKETAQQRDVITGLTAGDMTVIARGLTDGEHVVTDGQSRLNPGAHVALLRSGADTGTAHLSRGNTAGAGASASASGDVNLYGGADTVRPSRP
jgi:membrane fusion protein, multidrug efflux system